MFLKQIKKVRMKFLKKTGFIFLLIPCFLIFNLIEKKKFNKKIDLFSGKKILNLEIKFNFSELIKDVGEERSYHQAILKYKEKKHSENILKVTIKTRGKYRRDSDYCDFPPLKIHFKNEEISNTIFKNQAKLKLVTHCKTEGVNSEQYIIKEYLIYKAYNLFTKYSFRVRLCKINYIDEVSKDSLQRFGFLIEKPNYLAKRCNGKMKKTRFLEHRKTNHYLISLLSVFQYMIGNTDWSVYNLHNIKLLYVENEKTLVPIPYDFDFTGLVNIPTAEASTEFGLETVSERLFRGYCRTEGEFQYLFDIFKEKKDSLYSIFQGCSYLEKKHKRECLEYLDSFYETINSDSLINQDFFEECRSWEEDNK